MDAKAIYTRRRFGIDINVLLVMLVAVLMCIALLSYSLASKKSCTDFNISAAGYNNQKNNNFIAGESVLLNSSLPVGKNIAWDFGDGTPIAVENSAIHVFLKAGKFIITATQNGQCSETISVNVQKPSNYIQPNNDFSDKIIGNASTKVGTPEKYTCSIKASSYEWSASNATDVETKKGVTVIYQFALSKAYDLQVKLDNDPSKIYHKTIYVTEDVTKQPATQPDEIKKLIPTTGPISNNTQATQPVVQDNTSSATKTIDNNTSTPNNPPVTDAPPADKPITKYIHDESFQGMLEDLIKGNGEMGDFLPYLYYGANTKVWENGKWTTFAQLFKNLKNKKVEIKSFTIHREENKNIQNITIDYKKESLIKRLL